MGAEEPVLLTIFSQDQISTFCTTNLYFHHSENQRSISMIFVSPDHIESTNMKQPIQLASILQLKVDPQPAISSKNDLQLSCN